MWRFDQSISSKLDGLFDDRPISQAWAVLAAKYLLLAFFGLTIVVYPWIGDRAYSVFQYDLLFVTAVLVPQGLTIALSFLFRRKRPYEVAPDMWHLPIRVYTPSFPSGHATMAFATATFLVWYWHPVVWLAILIYLIAILVALARVVVGVHYLTAVVAGAVIGSLISWLTTGMIVRILLTQISI